ncbi:ABC transporter permease [Georgenia yuyongxinii]|uniref:ABC transporter permease n=1 Tax=Georgenia yuyongxinii TaxID=2589797 RepID=A0A5B8C6Y1_9MICO|nr:ABC transporter permease [Georgenia yuyongxinii]QDC25095.1 ABC transporter permease [Georgenia yuyongxinii]
MTAVSAPDKGLRRDAAARARTRPAKQSGTSRLATVGLPVLAVVIIAALWWLATVLFEIPEYLVPGPQVVTGRLVELGPYLLQQTWVTLGETLAGFVLSILIGIPVAMAIARFRVVELMIYPLLLAVNSVPKVAIAPILVVWMGFGQTPKIVMVILLCFFPIVLSTVSGLRSTPSELVELSRSLDASNLQEFRKIRFRWAMPQIFVGLKNAISLAVIGAVIAEFVGASSGLGFVIVQSGASADTALAFAAIVLLALISIVLFYLLVWLEKVLLPWAEENR